MPHPDDAPRPQGAPVKGPERVPEPARDEDAATWGGEGGAGSYVGSPSAPRPKDVPASKKG